MPSATGHNLGQTNNQFLFLPPYGIGAPGGTVIGGGGGVPEPFFRDNADAKRSMYRRVPSAEYPDGYLGTISGRSTDKFLRQFQGRLNERNYQRGVHKGERIDPTDYWWPAEFNPMSGLIREAAGVQANSREAAPRSTSRNQQWMLGVQGASLPPDGIRPVQGVGW